MKIARIERIDRVTALITDYVTVTDPYQLGSQFFCILTKVTAEFTQDPGNAQPLSLTLEGKRMRRYADGSVRPAPRNREDPVQWSLCKAQRSDLKTYISADMPDIVSEMELSRLGASRANFQQEELIR